MPKPIRHKALTLSRTLMRPASNHACRLEICHGACCVGGIWTDVAQIQVILAHASDIAPLLASDRRDTDGWFTAEVMEHADFPSGIGSPTATGPRPDGSGRTGCVFLLVDNTCALQRTSDRLGLGWPGLKPWDCATFPVLRSEGRVAWDRSVRQIPEPADCRPRTRQTSSTAPFYRTFRTEVELTIGSEGYARLEALAARRTHRTVSARARTDADEAPTD